MDMDNLRFLLETARTGKLREAAARLRVDETTVSRRIARLEKELGVRLFDRSPHGWQLTESGRSLLPHAEAIESEMSRAQEVLNSRSADLTGKVRILTTDGFGANVLIPGLGPLMNNHSGLELEILTGTAHSLFTARDFDLAVTLERPRQGTAVVHHLADYDLRFYASAAYLEQRGEPDSIDELRERRDLVWYIDTILDVQPLRFLEALIPQAHVRIQTNNITGHLAAARAGLGIVPLPTYIAAEFPDLRQILSRDLHARRSYWVATPRELSTLRRVRVVTAAIREIAAAHPRLYQRAVPMPS